MKGYRTSKMTNKLCYSNVPPAELSTLSRLQILGTLRSEDGDGRQTQEKKRIPIFGYFRVFKEYS